METGQANGVAAADLRGDMAHAVPAVVDDATAILRNNSSIRLRIDVTPLDLIGVGGQQADAVRIGAAQIGGDQRGSDQARLGFGDVERFQNALAEGNQVRGKDADLGLGHV